MAQRARTTQTRGSAPRKSSPARNRSMAQRNQTHGNLALAPQPRRKPAPPQEKPRAKLHVVKKTRRNPVQIPFAKRLAYIGMVLAVFIGGILFVTRLTEISKNNIEISQLREELALQQQTAQELKSNLALASSLDNVMQVAENELQMKAPKEEDKRIVALHIPSENEVPDTAVAQAEEGAGKETEESTGGLTAMIENIKGWFQ